jgi:uncharacterized protein YjdB
MLSPSPSYGVTISNVRVNGGGDTVTVEPGAALNVTLSYSIVDTACPGCIDQIQVGFSSGKPFTCVYNGVPGASGKSGTASFTTTAPSTPGTYYLAFDRSQAYSCPANWWNGVPPAQRYFAQIGVGPTLTAISISPSEYTISQAPVQFTAVGTYSDGSTRDVTTSATWRSADSSIATVYNTAPNIGSVQGVSNGKTTISATVGDITGSTGVTVTLLVYSISPANTTVPLGATKQLKFLLTWGGNSDDRTASSAWSSSDTAIATVSAGVVTPVAIGTVTITANWGGNRASATVGVTKPSTPVLKVAPIGRIDKGGTGQLTAKYIDANGVTQDVTASAMWASANQAVATVRNGTVSGLSSGTTTIRATYGGLSASVDVVVVALTAISISPSEFTINQASYQFTAVGTYSDGSTKDVTTSATWRSADSSIATVYNTAPNIGDVRGVSNGKTTISATVGDITGSTGVTVTITVYSISPANTTVPLNATKQLKFTSSGGTDLTTDSYTAWSSSNKAIATVSSTGVVTPMALGTVTITASWTGNRASATVGVTKPSTPVLKVAPINRIDKGGTGQLTAKYTDANGVTQDVTASAMWASANKAVASVTSGTVIGPNGTVSGLSDGTTTIKATYGGLSASVIVDVATRPLSGWFISPCNPSINLGSRRALSYYYVFPQGYISDETGDASTNWSSSNPDVASVSGGTVTGVALGQATITAESTGNRNTVVVTVVSSGANSWNLAPCNPTIPVGAVRQLTFKSPDNSFDATESANWSSSNSAIVTVNRGTIKGVSAGQATITAESSGNRISTTVTVQ